MDQKRFIKDIGKAVSLVAGRHDVEAVMTAMTAGEDAMVITVRVGLPGTVKVLNTADPDISPESRSRFEIYHKQYAIEPDALGVEFVERGVRYKLVGLAPSRPTYPLAALRMPDRKLFKFRTNVVDQINKLARERRDQLQQARDAAVERKVQKASSDLNYGDTHF